MKTYKLIIGGERYEAKVLEYTPTHAKICINGTDYLIQIEDDTQINIPKLAAQEKAVPLAPSFSSGYEAGSGEMRAPIPGVIAAIPVKEGDAVKKGQTIIVLEAMKMESEIAAPVDGVIGKILVKERSPVQEGDLLMILKGDEIKEKPVAKPIRKPAPAPVEPSLQGQDKVIRAPIPGTIIEVKVRPGDRVEFEQSVLTLEAMKMESEIHSSFSGRVKTVHVQKGDSVQEGDPLLELED